MAELTQRQQERISKSSSDRLRTQLVRSGVDKGEVGQMAEKPGHVDARLQPLPDDGEELFLPPQVAAPKYEYDVLRMKMELRKMELEAEARQAEARRAEREAEARRAEREADREAEARKAQAERETRRMELEMELRKIELEARVQGGDDESGATGLEGTEAAASDHS